MTMILYHGTTRKRAKSILRDGLRVSYCEAHLWRDEQPRGIYLAPDPETAMRWGVGIARIRKERSQPVVFRVTIDETGSVPDACSNGFISVTDIPADQN